jgi:hypothetical protein
MRTIVAVIAFLAVIGLPAVADAHDCLCQSNDASFHPEGSVVCLRVNGEDRLARCEKVLNNTSWRILGQGCLVAALTVPAAPATAPNLRASLPAASRVR